MKKQAIIDNLNEQQIDIVTAPLEDMLIQAGAGTGKTKVLVSRIAYLLDIEQIKPWNILAVTFTNKAAKEMKQRVQAILDNTDLNMLEICTIHSFCVKVLRRFYQEANLPKNFSVITDEDKVSLLKNLFEEQGLKISQIKDRFNYTLKDVISSFRYLDTQYLPYKDLSTDGPKYIQGLAFAVDNYSYDDFCQYVHLIYNYLCYSNGLIDFNLILIKTRNLLRDNKEVLKILSKRYRHILIDEVQDCDEVQAEIFALIKQDPEVKICLIGDEDQAIYSWRGGNAYAFEKYDFYPKLVQKELTINYRSNQNILNVANSIISCSVIRRKRSRLVCPLAWNLESKANELAKQQNPGQVVKQKVMVHDPKSPKVVIACPQGSIAPSSYEDFIYSLVNMLHDQKHIAYKDIAILYRNNSLSLPAEQALMQANISYQVFGGMKFYERKEILDSLAYLRLIFNPTDNHAFIRVCNNLKIGVGKATLKKLTDYANSLNLSYLQALEHCIKANDQPMLKPFKKLIPFYDKIQYFKQLVPKLELDKFLYTVITQSGIYEIYNKVDHSEKAAIKGNSHCDNLMQFVLNARSFIQKSVLNNNQEFVDLDENGVPIHKDKSNTSDQSSSLQSFSQQSLLIKEQESETESSLEQNLEEGNVTNLEFDPLSKYIKDHALDLDIQDFEYPVLTAEQKEELVYNFVTSSTLIASAEANEGGNFSDPVDAVNLMTIHASKGLEFKAVIVIGFTQDILPSARGEPEEERRIAYVAVTRAKEYLYLLSCDFVRGFDGLYEGGFNQYIHDLERVNQKYKARPYLITTEEF